MLLSQSDYN